MKLAEVSVKRPVFAIMMTAALIVLGAFSYKDLGLDLMPKTDSPNVNVQVQLPGASAEEVETQITKRIEEAVNTISGIDELRANSNQGQGQANITFALERDIESATQDVRDKVATIVGQFPRDAKQPQITKQDPDASPILQFNVFGPRSQKEITQIADKQIKQVLETLKDVGAINLQGDRKREIQLLLNADRLNAYGLSVDEVRTAVTRQNVEVPGGNFIAGPSEVALRTMGRIKNVDDFNRIVIAYRDGSVVTFADVGRVQDTVQEIRQTNKLNGVPSVGLQVRKQSGTNTVEVVDRVLAKLDQIQATLPSDLKISIGNDQSRFIRRSFEDIRLHLLLGGLLASVVVFFFIRNLRVTLIAALAVPASIIGTFTFMKIFGFTLNNMTMLALVAGNRHRHRRRDRRARKHLQVRRGERAQPEGGRGRRHRGNRPGRDGDDPVAGRDLRAGGLHDRPDRPLLLQFRHHLGGRDSDLDVRVLHAHSGAVRDVAEEGGREGRSLDHQVGRRLREDGCRLRQDAHLVASPPAADDGDRGSGRGLGRLSVSDRRQGARAGRRPGRVQHQRAPAQRHELSRGRKNSSSRSNRKSWRCRS